MKHIVEHITALLLLASWLAGLVLAKGFWPTFFAIFAPPWAWYLVAERLMQAAGWIS